MDVAEPPRGHRYVLLRYLYMAVDFDPLAVQAALAQGVMVLKVPFRHTWSR
jgi:hypothetical protein